MDTPPDRELIAASAPAAAAAEQPALVRRLAANTVVQVGGNLVASLIGLLTFVAATRGLGADGFGELTTALVFLMIPAVLADVGLSTVVLREISARPERTGPAMRSSLPLRAIVSGIGLGVAVALSFALPFSGEARSAIVIGSVASFLTLMSQGLLPVLQAQLRMHWAVLGSIAGRLTTLGLTVVVLARGGGIESVMAATVVGAAVTLLLQLAVVARIVSLVPSLDFAYWRLLLRGSVTIGLALAIAQIYLRIDLLLVAAFLSPTEVGLYGAAFKFVELADLVGAAIGISVFPLLARFVKTDLGRAASLYQRAFDLLIAAAMPLALLMALAATPLVVLISGEEFREASGALQLLAPFVLLSFVGGLSWRTLIAFGEARALLVVAVGALTLKVAANLVAIPLFGVRGAAVASVLTEIVAVTASVGLLHRRHSFLPSLRYVASVLPAGAVMSTLLLLVSAPVLVRSLLAGSAYVVMLLLLPGTVRDVSVSNLLPAARRALFDRRV